MLLHRDRNLEFSYRDNVANALVTVVATNALPIGTYTGWVNVSRDSATGAFTFRLSSDAASTAINSINWTVFSSGTSVAGRNLQLSTNPVRIGAEVTGSVTRGFSGLINRAIVSETLNSTILVDFNPASYNRATSQTTWTSATGEVWTLNTAATNNALKAAIVDRTMIMGNGTTYGMQASSLNMVASAMSSYTLFRKFVNITGDQIITELGPQSYLNSGFVFGINYTGTYETIGIRGNIGANDSNYTQTNLGLKLATGIRNIANAIESQPYLVNNVAATFISQNVNANNTAAMNGTGYNLLARNNAASAWANVIFCGDLVFSGEDDATTRTAMYNAIKTFTNGI
jgi:GH24 family phage-related lysozyme (muramidase)